jgi:AAA domain-containing protein
MTNDELKKAVERLEHDAAIRPREGPAGGNVKMAALTLRRPLEILDIEFSPDDLVLQNGYLCKGDPLVICGAPAVGKSRLAMQLVISVITGRDFLGWHTNGKGSRWLFLQSENSCRRLKDDLSCMFSMLSEEEKRLVDDCLVIHTLETGDDSFLHLNVPENQERVGAAIEQFPWTGVIFDVLRDYSVDDLNSDWGMQETLAMIGRLTRKKNPHCIPIIIHHARTGKLAAASAIGFGRGSFGRNSKVLLGWARAQINVAPLRRRRQRRPRYCFRQVQQRGGIPTLRRQPRLRYKVLPRGRLYRHRGMDAARRSQNRRQGAKRLDRNSRRNRQGGRTGWHGKAKTLHRDPTHRLRFQGHGLSRHRQSGVGKSHRLQRIRWSLCFAKPQLNWPSLTRITLSRME